MYNKKHRWRFEYDYFYIRRIFKACYWKGTYKHIDNWACKGLVNSRYYKIQDYRWRRRHGTTKMKKEQ